MTSIKTSQHNFPISWIEENENKIANVTWLIEKCNELGKLIGNKDVDVASIRNKWAGIQRILNRSKDTGD